MARFIPSAKPEDFNGSYGERRVYEALRSLDDRYVVFYSLSWVGIGERTLGEADFVVAHPDRGILSVEVKSGSIAYRDGTWLQTNTATGYTKEIDPLGQARRSSFELHDRIYHANLGFRIPKSGFHCAWFPSVSMSGSPLPPEAAPEIVLDERSLANPTSALDACFSYWEEKKGVVALDRRQFSRVIDVLCPHFNAVPRLRTQMDEAEESYIRLTHQQAALLDFLEEQDTAVIHGLAGTGKTVLAVEKAKRLASQGSKVLFLCFNRYLRDTLRANDAIPGVTFHNAHSLAWELHPMPGTPIDDVLADFEEWLVEVYGPDDWPYDNVIVDEGQDLDDRLLNRLYELVRQKHGCFYVFYDRNQYIFGNELPRWIEDAECRLVLHRNCRNTQEVFRTSCAIMGLQDVTYNDIHGEKPALSFYRTGTELDAIASSFVKRAISEGVRTEDIVILTARTTESSWLMAGKSYGGKELSLEAAPGKVRFTTIRKFKGLESEAILIVDASMHALENHGDRRLLYVGSSRAKNLLGIAMLEDIDRTGIGDVLKVIAPDRTVPRNKKGLKRLLRSN